MWNQIRFTTLSWLAIFLPLVLAKCPVPQAPTFYYRADSSSVTWAVTGTTLSCTKGYLVCWSQTAYNDVECDFVGATTGAMQLSGLAPCEEFNVTLVAYNWDGRSSATQKYNGTAGLPQVANMTVMQKNRDLTVLTWPSMSSYSCVQKLQFYLCDNVTQSTNSGCWYEELRPSVNKLEIRDLALCRTYYARIATASFDKTSVQKTFSFYLDSVSELTNLKARNVTQSSAEVEWWVSDQNTTCSSAERMALCYKDGSGAPAACSHWTLDRREDNNVTSLSNLDACTTYTAAVTLKAGRRYSNRTISFTTPLNADALRAAVTNVSGSGAQVTWSVQAAKRDCSPTGVRACLSRLANSTANTTVVSSSTSCKLLAVAPAGQSLLTLGKGVLAPCTAYQLSLTVLTTTSPRPTRTLRLVTPSAGTRAMASMNLTTEWSSIIVSWVPTSTSRQCLDAYNVSWSSSPTATGSWSTVDKDYSSYVISPVTAGLTYYVDVAAVFVDGNKQTLSGQIFASGSSRNVPGLSTFLKMLPVILFASLSEIRRNL